MDTPNPAFAGAGIGNMIDWSSCAAVERDPERVSGAWVFRGSRVPVAALFENLEDGVPVGQFAELFPGVTLEQARAVLGHAGIRRVTALPNPPYASYRAKVESGRPLNPEHSR